MYEDREAKKRSAQQGSAVYRIFVAAKTLAAAVTRTIEYMCWCSSENFSVANYENSIFLPLKILAQSQPFRVHLSWCRYTSVEFILDKNNFGCVINIALA